MAILQRRQVRQVHTDDGPPALQAYSAPCWQCLQCNRSLDAHSILKTLSIWLKLQSRFQDSLNCQIRCRELQRVFRLHVKQREVCLISKLTAGMATDRLAGMKLHGNEQFLL